MLTLQEPAGSDLDLIAKWKEGLRKWSMPCAPSVRAELVQAAHRFGFLPPDLSHH